MATVGASCAEVPCNCRWRSLAVGGAVAPRQEAAAREEPVSEHTVLKIPPEEVMVSTRAHVHGRGRSGAPDRWPTRLQAAASGHLFGDEAHWNGNGKRCHGVRRWSWRCALRGAVIVREIGVVTAAHVCQKGFLNDVITSIIGFLGGENKQYSDLMNEATQAAVKKLQQVASVSLLADRFGGGCCC